MTRFDVDLDELKATTADMQSFERTFEAKIAELDGLVSDLHGTWTGPAAAAQRDAHARWTSGAREMHQALTKMREAGERAHANYTAAADANVTMWDQV